MSLCSFVGGPIGRASGCAGPLGLGWRPPRRTTAAERSAGSAQPAAPAHRGPDAGQGMGSGTPGAENLPISSRLGCVGLLDGGHGSIQRRQVLRFRSRSLLCPCRKRLGPPRSLSIHLCRPLTEPVVVSQLPPRFLFPLVQQYTVQPRGAPWGGSF